MSTDGLPQSAPLPVPELVPQGAVSDDERNRYGVLLDHAAERGLLSPNEYRERLTELAEAQSIDAMQRIVTELPSFNLSGAPSSKRRVDHTDQVRPTAAGGTPDPDALDSALWASLTPATPRRTSGNHWLILAVMIVGLLISMVVLALVAAHMAHAHHTAIASGVGWLSPIHL